MGWVRWWCAASQGAVLLRIPSPRIRLVFVDPAMTELVTRPGPDPCSPSAHVQ